MTAPQPPAGPGPDRPFTLQQMMPAPTAPVAGYQAPPGYPPPPQVGGPPRPPGPPRKPHWWRDLGRPGQIVVIVAAVLVPVILGTILVGQAVERAGRGDINVDITSCVVGPSSTASLQFTAQNTGKRNETVRLRWEYRSGGKLLDTDSTTVRIPAGETVIGGESTFLPVSVSSGTCHYAGVSR